MAPSKNKPPQSLHIEKICLWTKFQPPTWLLALSGPVFLFEPKNILPRLMAPSKNKPARSSCTEKICLWTRFQPPTYMAPGSVSTRFPVSARKQTTPIDGAIQIKPARCSRIEKKYASGPNFSPLKIFPGASEAHFPISVTK